MVLVSGFSARLANANQSCRKMFTTRIRAAENAVARRCPGADSAFQPSGTDFELAQDSDQQKKFLSTRVEKQVCLSGQCVRKSALPPLSGLYKTESFDQICSVGREEASRSGATGWLV
jgi:hypothetical protein